MAETFCSTRAMAAAMPPVKTLTDNVELKLLYDPFEPEKVETHEIVYQDDKWLSDYLGELPEEGSYMLFFNGEELDLEAASITPVGRGDRIGLIVMPQGGDAFKSIFRIVLQVAAIAAFFVLPIWAAIAINIAVGLINAFLLTPKPPKSQDRDERSYGIDGAKNSATEGIPYPVVYGEFRVAGNFSDTYTENVGDDQYLYLRTILNDGQIESATNIEVNEQPIANFRQVQHRVNLGTLTEDVNSWFRSSVRQVNRGVTLDTGWTTHVTTSEVDQLRFDVTFPMGLVDIDQKKNKYRSRRVTFQVEARQVQFNGATGNWDPVSGSSGTWAPTPHQEPIYDEWGTPTLSGLWGDTLFGNTQTFIQAAAPVVSVSTSQPPAIEYREVGQSAWNELYLNLNLFSDGYVADPSGDGSLFGPTNVTPLANTEVAVALPPGQFELRAVNGATINRVTSFPNSFTGSFVATDSRTRAIRRTFMTQRLAKGYYEFRVRRTTPTSTDQYIIDEVILTDIAEIVTDPVAMRGTANLSLRIKLDEQLNNIPQLTCVVRGSLLQEYDRDGNPTVKRWSANPAWIGLDILCGIERGAGMDLSRIDFPRWVEFAEYCDANNITFNGIFAENSNVGDALRQVLRIGHAAPIPFGTKVSVALDKPRDPVTLFTQASMVKGSFEVAYLSMQDRSNEFELTYYDRNDRNKAKTIRYVDPKAVLFNEMPRSASVSFVGIDNIVQARNELWRMIYANRLIIRKVSFETFMEAINLAIGEVALIQHDQMQWANSGRLQDGNTTTVINLDQPVERLPSVNYSALVHFSAIKRTPTPRTVSSVVGKRVLVNANGANFNADQLRSKRLVSPAGHDYEIVGITNGSTFHTITLAEAPVGISSGALVDLFDTDVVEERPVSNVSQNLDGTSTVTLASAFSAVPEQYANFAYGRVENVRKPYVLTGVSGSGVEKRKLEFMEYHDGVYGPPEVDIPIPVNQVNDRVPPHVTGLFLDYERLVPANRQTVNVKLSWTTTGIRNYGGADIYMRLNGANWVAAGSVVNATDYATQLAPGDVVEFQVIAFTSTGFRAPAITAPSISVDLIVVHAELDPPTGVNVTHIAFEVDAKVAVNFTPPADATGVENYEVQYRRIFDTNWTSVGYFANSPVEIPGLQTGNYVARVRSASQTSTSEWVQDNFLVAITPGSLMANWNSSNDRNATPVVAPTLPSTGVVEHTLNRDGSANLSFEWLWNGDEAEIDGFVVTITDELPT
jgi:hypothetical protein